MREIISKPFQDKMQGFFNHLPVDKQYLKTFSLKHPLNCLVCKVVQMFFWLILESPAAYKPSCIRGRENKKTIILQYPAYFSDCRNGVWKVFYSSEAGYHIKEIIFKTSVSYIACKDI